MAAKKPASQDDKSRPSKEPVLYVRLSEELDAELDLWVEEERCERPGHNVTKSDLVRGTLIQVVKARQAARKARTGTGTDPNSK